MFDMHDIFRLEKTRRPSSTIKHDHGNQNHDHISQKHDRVSQKHDHIFILDQKIATYFIKLALDAHY